jgi:hypothetical protein
MRTPTALLLAATFALAGCTSATVGTVPAPEPSTGLSVETQRAEAQAGIAVAEGIQVASLLTAVLQQLPLGGGTLPSGACKDGVEITVTVLNPEQLKVVVDAFYDAACTARLAHALLKTTFFPSGTLVIDGASTAYDTRGDAVAYARFTTNGTVASTGAHAVTTGTVSRTPAGPAQLQFGLTCTLAATNDCGFGGVVAVASRSQSLGVAAALNGFTGKGAANGTVSLKGYGGALGALTLKRGGGDAWTVRGGSLIASTAGTFDERVNQKGLDVTGHLHLKDPAANAGVSLAFGTRTGISHGAVDSLTPAKLYATFGTDATGTGSIAYSQGPGGRIVFFIIQS